MVDIAYRQHAVQKALLGFHPCKTNGGFMTPKHRGTLVNLTRQQRNHRGRERNDFRKVARYIRRKLLDLLFTWVLADVIFPIAIDELGAPLSVLASFMNGWL